MSSRFVITTQQTYTANSQLFYVYQAVKERRKRTKNVFSFLKTSWFPFPVPMINIESFCLSNRLILFHFFFIILIRFFIHCCAPFVPMFNLFIAVNLFKKIGGKRVISFCNGTHCGPNACFSLLWRRRRKKLKKQTKKQNKSCCKYTNQNFSTKNVNGFPCFFISFRIRTNDNIPLDFFPERYSNIFIQKKCTGSSITQFVLY